MKTKVKFLDKNRNKVSLQIDIDNGRLSICGEVSGSMGQCLDSISPDGDAQTKIISIWRKYHLNDMKAGTPKQEEAVKECKTYNESINTLLGIDRESGKPSFMDVKSLTMLQKDVEKWENEIKILLDWKNTEVGKKADILEKNINTDNNTYFEDKKREYETELIKAQIELKKIENTLLYDILPSGELYNYGSAWLTEELPEDIEENIEEIIETIEIEEEDKAGEPLTDMEEDDLIKFIEGNTDFEGRDAELCAAFVYMFDLSANNLGEVEIDETKCTIQGIDYLAGTDVEMDEAWDEELENYIDECIEIPKGFENYFDREAWKKDARMDGRGHSLNGYDGGEEEQKVNGTYYFAYRS